MKQLKKAVSLVAVLAFLITALVPVSGLAAPSAAPVNGTAPSGDNTIIGTILGDAEGANLQLEANATTDGSNPEVTVYVWKGATVTVKIPTGVTNFEADSGKWGAGDDLAAAKSMRDGGSPGTDGSSFVANKSQIVSATYTVSSTANYAKVVRVIPVAVKYQLTGDATDGGAWSTPGLGSIPLGISKNFRLTADPTLVALTVPATPTTTVAVTAPSATAPTADVYNWTVAPENTAENANGAIITSPTETASNTAPVPVKLNADPYTYTCWPLMKKDPSGGAADANLEAPDWSVTTADKPAKFDLTVTPASNAEITSMAASPTTVPLGLPITLSAVVNNGDSTDTIAWYAQPTAAPANWTLSPIDTVAPTLLPAANGSPSVTSEVQTYPTATATSQWYRAVVQEDASATDKPDPVWGTEADAPKVDVVQLYPLTATASTTSGAATFAAIKGIPLDLEAIWGAVGVAAGTAKDTAAVDLGTNAPELTWFSGNSAATVGSSKGLENEATVINTTGPAGSAIDITASYRVTATAPAPAVASFSIQPVVLAQGGAVVSASPAGTAGDLSGTLTADSTTDAIQIPLGWYHTTTPVLKPDNIAEGITVTWSLTKAPDGVALGPIATSAVDASDGSVTAGEFVLSTPGDYTVTALATDEDGAQVGGGGLTYNITVPATPVHIGDLQIDPATKTVQTGTTQKFTAMIVTGEDPVTTTTLPASAGGSWSAANLVGVGNTDLLNLVRNDTDHSVTINPDPSLAGQTFKLTFTGSGSVSGTADAVVTIVAPETVSISPAKDISGTASELAGRSITGTPVGGKWTIEGGDWSDLGLDSAPTAAAFEINPPATQTQKVLTVIYTTDAGHASRKITIDPETVTPGVPAITQTNPPTIVDAANTSATVTGTVSGWTQGNVTAATGYSLAPTNNAGTTISLPTANVTFTPTDADPTSVRITVPVNAALVNEINSAGGTKTYNLVATTGDGNQTFTGTITLQTQISTPQTTIVGAPLLNATQPATVVATTNAAKKGDTVTLTLSDPQPSADGLPASIEISGVVGENGVLTLNVPDAAKTQIWNALATGEGVTYTVTGAASLGVPAGSTVTFVKPQAVNVVFYDPATDTESGLPANTVEVAADGELTRPLRVVDANGDVIPGSWVFAGDAGTEQNTIKALNGQTLPTPTVQQLIQPRNNTSATDAVVNVELGVAPGIYTIIYNTSSARTQVRVNLYVDAIWPAVSTIDYGQTLQMTAYRYTRQAAGTGTWTLPANGSLTDTNTTPPTTASTITVQGTGLNIPQQLTQFSTSGVPTMRALVDVNARQTFGDIRYTTQGEDGATSGKLVAPPATTLWTDLNKNSQTSNVLNTHMQVKVNDRFELWMPNVATTDAGSQRYTEWQFRTVDGGNPIIIPTDGGFYGVNSNTLVSGPITATMDGYQFRLVGRDTLNAGTSAPTTYYSPWVQLDVTDADKVREQPQVTITSSPESNAGTVTIAQTGTVILSAAVQDGLSAASLAYQWQSRPAPTAANPNPSFADIPDETNRTLTLENVQAALNGVSYQCIVSNNSFNGIAGTSNSLTLRVNTQAVRSSLRIRPLPA